jgi:xanthine/uracil permease
LVSPADTIFGFLNENYSLLVFLLVFALLYASFGRLKIFHHNRPAQTIVALVLAFGTSGIVQSAHWNQLTNIVAGLIAAGIVLMVLWAVTLQRGRTRQEEERRHAERMHDRK